MKYSDRSVGEIAAYLGFGSLSYFSDHFKKRQDSLLFSIEPGIRQQGSKQNRKSKIQSQVIVINDLIFCVIYEKKY